ncbi:hypothetical protein B0H10DRAFT_2234955 [Mycena sp. CBHHK59/15]|nr:hypothetical protein B0H10DRAFT_2234955 [Mycena sp. CBHHK59/15]
MVAANLPTLSEEEQQTIASLCQGTLFAAWDEDSAVEDINYRLRQLWETALHIGFAHGREEANAAGRKEGKQMKANVAMQLEEERVWGFDVGWKLCSEQVRARAQTASVIQSSTPSTPSRSLSDAATQTTTAPNVVAAPSPLDWAADAETFPFYGCPSAVCQLAALPSTCSMQFTPQKPVAHQ